MTDIIQNPYSYWPDLTRGGRAIYNGKIYVGIPDTNPRAPANQVRVFYLDENDVEIDLQQPVRTSTGGIPVNASGDEITLKSDTSFNRYSLALDDRSDNQVIYIANAEENNPKVVVNHNDTLNRNAAGAHDDIYARNFKNVADLRSQTDSGGNTIDLSLLAGSKVFWRGYNSESDGGGNWGIVKTGDSSSLVDDGGSIFVIVSNSVNGVWVEANLKGKRVNVKKFGAVGDGTANDTESLENAFSYLSEYQNIFFPAGDYKITRMLRTNLSHIAIEGVGKYLSRISPHSSGFEPSSGTSLVWVGDGTTTARVQVMKIEITAAFGSLGNDLDALTVHPFFNCDISDCRLQGGNYVTRETGGLRIVDGRHTRVKGSQFHNGFCHGIVIDSHLNGLNITNCAFDETSTAIKSLGNILEMNITGANEFGSAIRNPSFPAPTDRRIIDLTVGSHGSIGIVGNIFTGGSETEFGVRWSFVENLRVHSNQLGQSKRFALCGDGTGRNLSIGGNTFNDNGTDATDLNPANGLRNPDTTPFCSDIYLNSAFVYPTNIFGNTSDRDDRVIGWIEGTSNGFSTSGFSCSANNSRFDDAFYIHQRTIRSNDVYQDTSLMVKGIAPVEGTITTRTVTRGTPQFGNITYSGVLVGDILSINVKNAGTLDYNLVLSAEVLSSNSARWSLVNTSDTPITITDVDVVISAIKP